MFTRLSLRAKATRWIFIALLLAVVVLFPFLIVRPRFWIGNVAVPVFWMSVIALSLVFLNRYVGLLSLAQVSIGGVAGYGMAYVSITHELPYTVGIVLGLAAGVVAGFLTALVAIRTKAIYFLMITLALSQVFYTWAAQADAITGARRGIAPINRDTFGPFDFRDLTTFYFACAVVAIGALLLCIWVARTNFGLVLQGIKDNPARMSALGYHVVRYRVAAFTFAAFVASLGGILMAFHRSQMTPDLVGLNATLDILIVAVLGGIASLGGVFLGATVLVLLNTFAQDFTDRYMTVTGLVFIAILMFAPNGLFGIGAQLKRVFQRRLSSQTHSQHSVDTARTNGKGENQ